MPLYFLPRRYHHDVDAGVPHLDLPAPRYGLRPSLLLRPRRLGDARSPQEVAHDSLLPHFIKFTNAR